MNGAYSRNNLSKIKDGADLINLDEYESIETQWIALYVNPKNVTYCDSFGVEHILKEESIQIYFLLTNIKRMTKYY